jgi:hypothetical protein
LVDIIGMRQRKEGSYEPTYQRHRSETEIELEDSS